MIKVLRGKTEDIIKELKEKWIKQFKFWSLKKLPKYGIKSASFRRYLKNIKLLVMILKIGTSFLLPMRGKIPPVQYLIYAAESLLQKSN